MATKESIYTKHSPAGDNLYLKLKDGDKVKLRVYSEPAVVLFKPKDKLRYALVVWNHDKKLAQVFNFGVSIFNQIADLVEEWGIPQDFDITIKREGSGMTDTSYTVNPVRESTAMTKEQEAEADKVDLIQATKGKWLADYVEDGILPEPVTDGLKDADEPLPTMPEGEDIDPATIPF